MINHARTLLLNKDGASRPAADYFLEEYVDPAYKALRLPSYLKTMYEILIGERADHAYANYRLWQYMLLLHSTEMVEYVTALDSRVTYLNRRSLVANTFKPQLVALNPAAQAAVLHVGGALQSLNRRLQYDWTLEALTPLQLSIVSMQPNQTTVHDLVFTAGLSNQVLLPGQKELRVQLSASPPIAGSMWQLTAFAEPVNELPGLVEALELLGDGVVNELFGSGEPYKTFRKLWEHHPYTQYKLCGMLLAYIYRAEEVRLNGR